MKTLYQILGCKPTDTIEKIKAAYRKLTKKHHPDRGGNPEKFKEIQEAWEVLSDPELRAAYDRDGTIGKKQQGMPEDQKLFTLIQGLFDKTMSVLGIDAVVPQGDKPNPFWRQVNFVETMRDQLKKAIKDGHNVIKDAKASIERWKRLRDKLIKKNGDNYFHHVINHKILSAESDIRNVEEGIKDLQLVQEWLVDCEHIMEVVGASGTERRTPGMGEYAMTFENFFK